MFFTTLNENGKIVFNEEKSTTCPYCHSVDVRKTDDGYKCPECKNTFTLNDNKDDDDE